MIWIPAFDGKIKFMRKVGFTFLWCVSFFFLRIFFFSNQIDIIDIMRKETIQAIMTTFSSWLLPRQLNMIVRT